jgi:hypothetical protein
MNIRMVRTKRQFSALLVLTGVMVTGGFTAWLLGCGPFSDTFETFTTFEPAHRSEFGRGQLSVVSPQYARRYLVQAYRVFSGRPALSNAALTTSELHAGVEMSDSPDYPMREWTARCNRVLGGPAIGFDPFRRLPEYQQFQNCTDDAFRNAARTLEARIRQFRASSPEVRDWTRAQVAVFRNCSEETLVLPERAATAESVIRADRAYQTAAAYFYAMQYEEAARRFRAIAGDRSSPWRPYGRYLAARANIRLATVPAGHRQASDAFTKAEADLKATLDDPDAARLHRSAQSLLNFIIARIRPVERAHALSKVLFTSPTVSNQDLIDYRVVLDRLIDVDPATSASNRRVAIENDDLTDWVLSMQRGAGDVPHIVQRWEATRSIPWLVAAFWHLPTGHPATGAILDAARTIERTSPAFPTVAFLLVRQLAAGGRLNDARALLATLPSKAGSGFLPEAVNLLNAERVMVAQTLDELLTSAPRTIVQRRTVDSQGLLPDGHTYDEPVLGEDAAIVFTSRLPLDRLVDAAESDLLPARLRVRVAATAFVRATVFQRDEPARRAVLILNQLAPALRDDVNRYVGATTAEERHRAAIFLLVRTPGMHASVLGGEDEQSYAASGPATKLDYVFHVNWWCGSEITRSPFTPWVEWLYPNRLVPYPAFLADTERAAVAREVNALVAMGPARNYLAAEAIKWARAKPADINAAEALARIVDGWRRSCANAEPSSWQLSREAFQTLHRHFPRSEWAKRTKYWYK